MFSTGWFRLVICASLLAMWAASAAGQSTSLAEATAGQLSDVTLYRVFLRDGSTIVSYGEFARVGDRVVVTLPIGAGDTPELQLLSLPSDTVDWDKTDAYAESARATRYGQTLGPNDFAQLSNAVTIALNDIAVLPDPQRKAAMAAEARQNVMKWAAEHYGYRAKDVAELAGLFDKVIAESRVAGGAANFDLSLVANMAEPPDVPMLPAPDVRESVEQAMRAAALVPDAAERTSLLRSIQKVLATIDGGPAWAVSLRARTGAALALEERTDRAYQALIHNNLQLAAGYARNADVTGVERIVRRVLREDDRLGQRRPNEVAAALATLDATLDSARRLRLARDSFAARAAVLQAYQVAIAEPLAALRTSRGALDEIRRLAGPSRARLARLSARAAASVKQLAAASVPGEAAPAHDLLRSAVALAGRAAAGRLKAIESGSMQEAWDASSAAAGALMLFDRVTDELRQLTTGK
jgi:hypothetical protein